MEAADSGVSVGFGGVCVPLQQTPATAPARETASGQTLQDAACRAKLDPAGYVGNGRMVWSAHRWRSVGLCPLLRNLLRELVAQGIAPRIHGALVRGDVDRSALGQCAGQIPMA